MYRRHPIEQADLKCNDPVSRVFTYMCAGAPVGTGPTSLITLPSFTRAPQWPTAHQVGEAGWPVNPRSQLITSSSSNYTRMRSLLWV